MSTTFIPSDDFVTLREAAELSGATLNTVKKAMAENVIASRKRGGRTVLPASSVGGLELLARTKIPLPRQKQRQLVQWASQAPTSGAELQLDPVLVVKVDSEFARHAIEVLRYVQLRNRLVVSDPEVVGGEPVIRGSRVPVRTIADRISLGEDLAIIKDDYAHLPDEAFEIAPIWARANPRTGRPRKP